MTARPSRPSRPGAALLVLSLLAAACVPDPAGRGSTASPAGSAAPASPSPVPVPSGPTPVPTFVRPTPTPLPTFLVVVVASGDSLTSIAHRYSTTPRSIAYWSRSIYPSLDPDSKAYRPDRLKVGWTLRVIPGATVDEEALPDESAAGDPGAGFRRMT